MKYLRAWQLLSLLCLSSVALANTFEAQGLFPGDTRTEVTHWKAPWSAVGRLWTPNRKDACTATLVAKNVILTAAHCVVENGKILDGEFRFYPAWGDDDDSFQRYGTSSKIWVGTTTPLEQGFQHKDWAIVRLNENIGEHYGMMNVRSMKATELINIGYVLNISGYSRDFMNGHKASWERGCGFVSLDVAGAVLHDCSITPGASGAPMFYIADREHPALTAEIVAMNVAERVDDGTHQDELNIPFSLRYANIAVPSVEFYSTLISVIAESP